MLQEAYRSGDDVHALTARLLLDKDEVSPDERRLGKTINFGVIYGMGAQRFARTQVRIDSSTVGSSTASSADSVRMAAAAGDWSWSPHSWPPSFCPLPLPSIAALHPLI